MNRCSAPCVGNISKEDYAFDIKNTINFVLKAYEPARPVHFITDLNELDDLLKLY